VRSRSAPTTPAEPPALDLVRRLFAREALPTVADALEDLGPDEATAAELLAGLTDQELVGVWVERRGRRKVHRLTLTPRAASLLGVVLVESKDGDTGALRWAPADGPPEQVDPGPPRDRRAPPVVRETDFAGRHDAEGNGWTLDALPDPKAADPADAAVEAGEWVRPRHRLERPPRPRGEPPRWTVPVGLAVPWPAAATPVCEGCGGRRLSAVEVCLVCDRVGFLGLPAVPEHEKPRPAAVAVNGRALAGGVAPAPKAIPMPKAPPPKPRGGRRPRPARGGHSFSLKALRAGLSQGTAGNSVVSEIVNTTR
jgi:hypothetical protein